MTTQFFRNRKRAPGLSSALLFSLALGMAPAAVKQVVINPLDPEVPNFEVWNQPGQLQSLTANGQRVEIHQAFNSVSGRNPVKFHYAWLEADEPVKFKLLANRKQTLRGRHKPMNPIGMTSSPDGKEWNFTLQPGDYLFIDSLAFFIFLEKMETGKPNAGDANVINVMNKGADPTGENLSSPAIQAAIDEAAANPQKRIVYVPKGHYQVGTLFMKSKVDLYLEAGAILKGTSNAAAWKYEQGPTYLADKDNVSSALLFFKSFPGDTVRDARVRGRGVLDGAIDYWRPDPCPDAGDDDCYKRDKTSKSKVVMFHAAVNCEIDGPMVRNPVFWSMHILGGSRNRVKNVKVIARYRMNNDGINFDNTEDARVDNCMVMANDDGSSIKNGYYFGNHKPNARDSITNTVLAAPGYPAVKFGWALHQVRDFLIDNTYMLGPVGMQFNKKFWPGTVTQEARVTNFTMRNSIVRGNFYTGNMEPDRIPDWKFVNLRFENTTVDGGFDIQKGEGVHFDRVNRNGTPVDDAADLKCTGCTGLTFKAGPTTATPAPRAAPASRTSATSTRKARPGTASGLKPVYSKEGAAADAEGLRSAQGRKIQGK